MADAAQGENVTSTLRLRVGQEDVHYGGGLVAGAFCMKLFGDLATEITVRTDGDEGLLRAYEEVEFLAPVGAGDFLEARAVLVRRGTTSRTCEFEVWKVIQGSPGAEASVLARLMRARSSARAGRSAVRYPAAKAPSVIARVSVGRSAMRSIS